MTLRYVLQSLRRRPAETVAAAESLTAGLVYAWLYRRTGRLWVPVVAHAVTNGVLGVWVVATGNWFFW